MEKILKFEFTVEQTNIVLVALGRMPYEAVALMIAEVQKQAQAQVGNQPRDMPVPLSEAEKAELVN